jgi:hypothetical protein
MSQKQRQRIMKSDKKTGWPQSKTKRIKTKPKGCKIGSNPKNPTIHNKNQQKPPTNTIQNQNNLQLKTLPFDIPKVKTQ